MARKKALDKSASHSGRARAADQASPTEKSVLLLLLGLFFLTSCGVTAIFEVPGVRAGATPHLIFGFGVVACVICCLISGHLTPAQLGALGNFLKSFSPTAGGAR